MNRRRIVIGLVVLAVALVCLLLFQAPAPVDLITLRFHSIQTNGLAQCVASNANRQNFIMSIVTEQETNGTFARLPPFIQYVDWDDGPNGFIIARIPDGPAHCRVVVDYQVAPRTKLGKMLDPIRTRLLGMRPIMRSYSDEFHVPP